MGDTSRGDRRRYDNRARAEKAAQTRERIITAGSELVHAFDSWNWQELTFRAVAERAGVGERTVYRHFPTERHLHDAVMQRLESEAGISYEDVDLHNLGEVTARVFASLQRFAVRESVDTPRDPTFVGVDARRREALTARRRRLRAGMVSESNSGSPRACSTCCGTCRATSDSSGSGGSTAPTPPMPSTG